MITTLLSLSLSVCPILLNLSLQRLVLLFLVFLFLNNNNNFVSLSLSLSLSLSPIYFFNFFLELNRRVKRSQLSSSNGFSFIVYYFQFNSPTKGQKSKRVCCSGTPTIFCYYFFVLQSLPYLF